MQISINKQLCDKDNRYTINNLNALKEAMRDLDAETFKVWVYFSRNRGGFTVQCSIEEARNFGIDEECFKRGIKVLIEKKYLIEKGFNNYQFNDLPGAKILRIEKAKEEQNRPLKPWKRGHVYKDKINVKELVTEYMNNKCNGAGIYGISIEDKLVYVGKSTELLRRLTDHAYGIRDGLQFKVAHKYCILAEAMKKGYKIKFEIIYKTQETESREIKEDIALKEAYYINKLKPALNYQIPNENDPAHFVINHDAHTITLEEILEK